MNNTTPAVMDQRSLYELLVVDQVLKQMLDQVKERKEQILNAMRPGEKIAIFNEREAEIGSISKTKMKKQAVIEDMAQALPALAERYELQDTLPDVDSVQGAKALELLQETHPELLTFPTPGSKEYVQAVNVLFEEAPELLGTPTIDDAELKEASEEVLDAWNAGEDAPAGWAVVDSSRKPYVSLRTNKTGKRTIAVMLKKTQSVFAVDAMHEIIEDTTKELEK